MARTKRVPDPLDGLQPETMTLRWLQDQGFIADVVERCVRNGHLTRRFDLFDMGDILAVPKTGVAGLPKLIQATTATHIGARLAKIRALDKDLLGAVGYWFDIEVWGWYRYKKPDAQGRFWRPKVVVL